MNKLQDLQQLVDELQQTNSVNEKKDILKKHPECKELLMYAYNPFYQYNVSSKNLEKRQDLIDYNSQERNILNILDELRKRERTGHNAISVVNGFIKGNFQYKDLIYNIIDKNLKIRIDAKVINSIYPNLIPQFDVALANKYEDQEHKIDFTKDTWLASRKLDGVRCITMIKDGDVKCYSRAGKEFNTLQVIKDELLKQNLNNVVLDGEICLVDENGDESYQGIMKQISRKNHVIESPKYMMFDMLTPEEFESKESESVFSKRVRILKATIDENKHLTIIDQIPVSSKEHLLEMTTVAEKSGWEGLIIRKDVEYKGKRSNDILKVKKMHDAEYEVIGTVNGTMRMLDKSAGVEVEEEMLSRVNILHRGNVVGVGSGFSLDQRKHYFKHPEEIVGKTITVKYFEECEDQTGKPSLRFPILKHIFEHGRDI